MEEKLYRKYDLDLLGVSLEDWKYALDEESEHDDVTRGDMDITAQIALAHFKEDDQYYTYLKMAMEKMKKDRKILYSMAKGVWCEIYVFHSKNQLFEKEEILNDISELEKFTKKKYIIDALKAFLKNSKNGEEAWDIIQTLLE